MYKRLNKRIIAVVLLISFLFLYSCDNINFYVIPVSDGFSVHFINVGQGDSALIRFDDGKFMLIDCGSKNAYTSEQIVSTIDSFGGILDYLVLTHTDTDHVGNACDIVSNLKVNKAYIPFIEDARLFPAFYNTVEKLDENGTELEYSDIYDYIEGENYFVAFLYPQPTGVSESIYDYVNLSDEITEEDTNDLSPMIYIEYASVRFLFAGDASANTEAEVINMYSIGMYSEIYPQNIILEDIDFLKVAHHGSSGSSTEDFLKVTRPKNAIFSVGGNNIYGHPSAMTMNRLIEANKKVDFWRTDVYGTVSVTVDADGNVNIITEAKK